MVDHSRQGSQSTIFPIVSAFRLIVFDHDQMRSRSHDRSIRAIAIGDRPIDRIIISLGSAKIGDSFKAQSIDNKQAFECHQLPSGMIKVKNQGYRVRCANSATCAAIDYQRNLEAKPCQLSASVASSYIVNQLETEPCQGTSVALSHFINQ